jgi:hypothetical protein
MPGMLQEPRALSGYPDGLKAWARHCQRYFRKWGLTVTGFVIDGEAPALNRQGLDCYASFSPNGIVPQKIGGTDKLAILHGKMPVLRSDWDIVDSDPVKATDAIMGRIALRQGFPFHWFRAILKSPSWYRNVHDELLRRDSTIQWLDAPAYFELLRIYLENGQSMENQAKQKQKDMRWEQRISVLSPAPCSDIKGQVEVQMEAKDLSHIDAHCFVIKKSRKRIVSEDIRLMPEGIVLDAGGRGRFSFNADQLPHGPLTIQITGKNEAKGVKDLYELQVYNTGGKRNKVAGIPDTIPAAAQGMKLTYFDDFDGPLSISRDGLGSRYNAHKPTFGDFSGWPFSDPESDLNPFRQRDTYLIIRARKPEGSRGSTGLLATVDMDGNGYRAKPPFYMECRLMAQSAPGTWPAFWTITNTERGQGDELDVIEAYGGWGEGNPNSTGYWVTSHFWNQNDAEGKPLKHPGELIQMAGRGMKTSWSQTFHTYGLRVDREYTIYYLDDQEVWRHKTNSFSFSQPHVLLINYAIGGSSGWKIDLERYGNTSEMYVDFVRVFEE